MKPNRRGFLGGLLALPFVPGFLSRPEPGMAVSTPGLSKTFRKTYSSDGKSGSILERYAPPLTEEKLRGIADDLYVRGWVVERIELRLEALTELFDGLGAERRYRIVQNGRSDVLEPVDPHGEALFVYDKCCATFIPVSDLPLGVIRLCGQVPHPQNWSVAPKTP